MLTIDVDDVWKAHDLVIKSTEVNISHLEQLFKLNDGRGIALSIV